MLCALGCSYAPRPSIHPAPTGNAYRLLLPPGTTITLPDDRAAAEIRAVAHNELAPGTGRTVALSAPLQLVSPAYIAGRNAAEISLLTLIADLRSEIASLRSR